MIFRYHILVHNLVQNRPAHNDRCIHPAIVPTARHPPDMSAASQQAGTSESSYKLPCGSLRLLQAHRGSELPASGPQQALVSAQGGVYATPLAGEHPIGKCPGSVLQAVPELAARPVLSVHLHGVPSSKLHQKRSLSAHSRLFSSFHNSFLPRKSRIRTTSSVSPSDSAIFRLV